MAVEKYEDFIKGKVILHSASGFECDLSQEHHLKPFQKAVVEMALRRGRSAMFEDTGLGKARQGLVWAREVYRHTGKNVLILTPCAVGLQMQRESASIGIDAYMSKGGDDLQPGLNIANYEKLHRFNPDDFGAIVLDESSILKGFQSKYRAQLTDFVRDIPYRLACTATPAPNDLLEIINHADWLGVMNGKESIAMFFTQDGNTTQKYRLKNTCKVDFWRWVASWAVCVRVPSDLGDYSDDGYNLPELRVHDVQVESNFVMTTLLPVDSLDLRERRQMRKESITHRVKAVADMVNASTDQWVIWCDFNDESDMLAKAIPDAAEIRGSQTIEQKERAIEDFTTGSRRVLISKASITGFGLNWQHCNKTAFVGVSDSFEQQYQAIRRFYRFGQTKPVDVYLVASEQEQTVVHNLRRKEKQSKEFYDGVKRYMQESMQQKTNVIAIPMDESRIESGEGWSLRLGDNVERIKELKNDSVGLMVTSVPFPGMYAYTDDPRDMGNVKDYDEFFAHMSYLIPELLRVLQPGRSLCVHLTQGVSMVSREGFMGLKDFRGDCIRAFQKDGFVYAGEVTVDQDPQLEAARNNTHGLLFKSLATDAAIMRPAMADYVVIFRKPGKSFEPIKAGKSAKYNPDGGWITEEEWIEWASPIWYGHLPHDAKLTKGQPYYPSLGRKAMHKTINKDGRTTYKNGIDDTDVANVRIARDINDERHLCPLQFGIIERCVKLFSNPGDLVLDPFNGVGSTGIKALELERQYVGFEIKPSYFETAAKNLRHVESNKGVRQSTIFDLIENIGFEQSA